MVIGMSNITLVVALQLFEDVVLGLSLVVEFLDQVLVDVAAH